MDKMKCETESGVERNVDRIAAMFPQVVTEVKGEDGKLRRAVKWDVLKELLSGEYVEGGECYDFTWPGKRAAIAEAAKPIRKTLRPCKAESKDWDTTENLYIEGDNLEVLKLLQESYLGKVKMIYIDPPYNTGNDFVYRDDFKVARKEYNVESGELFEDEETGETNRMFRNTESNGRFHSDWCSMIYSRLVLARDLLCEDGAIFISIDDNELDNLRRICNEVFGADNFRNTLLVRRRIKSLNSQFAHNGLSTMNVAFEYILVYAKSKSFLMQALKMKKDVAPEKGRWDVFWSNADRPTMRYDILGFTPSTGQWRNSKEKAMIAVENYITYVNNYSSSMTIEEYYEKTGIDNFIRRIPNATGKNGGVQHWIAPSSTSLRTSNWTDIEVSQIGKEIDLPFDNPKSKQLLIELVRLVGLKNNNIVLDFFSGSATTAHAVMQLNAEDGGKRKFIMVQLPEECPPNSEAAKAGYKNICEIGKERIRRAGAKIKEEAGLAAADLDVGFRVFKLDDSNMKDVYYSADGYSQDMLDTLISNIKEDRTDLDLLYGCLLEWGVELSLPHSSETIDGVTVHTVNNGDLIACFDPNIPESAIRAIAKRQPLRAVFRDSSFASAPQKINVEEIFKLLSPATTVKVI